MNIRVPLTQISFFLLGLERLFFYKASIDWYTIHQSYNTRLIERD